MQNGDGVKIGDKVRCIEAKDHSTLRLNKTYTVSNVGYSGFDVICSGETHYGYFRRFELVQEDKREPNKKDYKNVKVGDRILLMGSYSKNYHEMTVKEIADGGNAVKNTDGHWHNLTSKDGLQFVEIL